MSNFLKLQKEFENISNNFVELFNASSTLNDETLNRVKKVKKDNKFKSNNYNSLIGNSEFINKKVNKYIKATNNLNWEKMDDLIKAYIYTMYDFKPNSAERINKLKKTIYNELNISKQDELSILQEYNFPEIKQVFFNLKITNPVLAIILIGWIWWKTNCMLDCFYTRPDINITNKELDIKNEMRHITGLAFLTKIFGAEKARKLGYLKEHWDFFTHEDKKDTLIDFNNNEKGIAIAIQYPDLKMEQLIQKIYDVHIKNKRKI